MMKKIKSNKLEMNVFLAILLFIALFVIIGDILCFVFNLKYILQLIISGIIIIPIIILLKNKIKITKKIDKNDLIFFVFLLFIMIITLPFTDQMWDTLNYHLYLQERPFADKIFSDFFAGRWINSYSYALPDRMFYLFRFFLGYRLGVILNYLVVTVLYFQIKEFISKHSKLSGIGLSVVCTILTLNLSVLEQIDDYYVDILSLVFLFQLFILAFDKDDDKFILNSILFMFISGISFGIKLTNAFFVIVFGIIYLVKNIKNLKQFKWYHYIVLIGIFVLPFFVYMLYTFIQTGNPVFPFYNNIFKSKYYLEQSWLDDRFGPKRFLELIFWPIVAFFEPSRSADTHIIEPMWAIGFIVSFIYLIYQIILKLRKKDFNKNNTLLCIVSLILYFVWSKFLIGYSRYAIIVVLVGSLCCTLCLIDLINKKKILSVSIIFVLLAINVSFSGYNYLYSAKSLFYNNAFNTSGDSNVYKYNIKHLFDNNEKLIEFPNNSVCGVVTYNSGACIQINNNLDIINLTAGSSNEYTINILNEKLASYDHVYVPVLYTDLPLFCNLLNEYNFDILDLYTTVVTDSLEKYGVYLIFEVQKGNNIDSIDYYYTNITKDVSDYNNVNFSIFSSPYVRESIYDEYDINVIGITNNKEILIETVKKNSDDLIVDFFDIDVKKYDSLSVKLTKDGVDYPINAVMMNFAGEVK